MGFLSDYDNAFKAAFEQEYQAAEINQGPLQLPKGKYQLVVTDVQITDRNNLKFADGKEPDEIFEHSIEIEFEVLNECEYKGCHTKKYHGICLKAIRGLKADLLALGCEFKGLDALENDIASGAMLGIVLDANVTESKSKKDPEKVYSNIWLNKAVGRIEINGKVNQNFVPADDDELPWN